MSIGGNGVLTGQELKVYRMSVYESQRKWKNVPMEMVKASFDLVHGLTNSPHQLVEHPTARIYPRTS